MPFPECRISVCGCDSITRQKLKLYRKRIPDVQLFFAEKNNHNLESDLCVMPAECLPEYFESKVPAKLLLPPVLAYGPAETMALTLAAGSEDYLCEPWTPAEFFARAVRCRKPLAAAAGEGVIVLSPGRKIVYFLAEEPVETEDLSRSETVILTALLRNRGCFMNRSMISTLLGLETADASRAVDMHISRLRQKIICIVQKGNEAGTGGFNGLIRTASGHGWTIDPDL